MTYSPEATQKLLQEAPQEIKEQIARLEARMALYTMRHGSRSERKEYRKQNKPVKVSSPRAEVDVLPKRALRRQDKEKYRLERAAYWADFHEKQAASKAGD